MPEIQEDNPERPGSRSNPIIIKPNTIDSLRFKWHEMTSSLSALASGKETTSAENALCAMTPHILNRVEWGGEDNHFILEGAPTKTLRLNNFEDGFYVTPVDSYYNVRLKCGDVTHYNAMKKDDESTWKTFYDSVKEVKEKISEKFDLEKQFFDK